MVDTHPGDTNRLHEYWVHGKGAAQIKWGTPGDFDRCTRLLEEHAHFTPEQAHGYCNLAHHAATGQYPAQHAALIKAEKGGRSMADHGNLSTPNAADLDAAARKYCASQGWAMGDGSYPIRPSDMHGQADLQSAIQAVGRGGGSHDAIRKHIMGRAKAIGMSKMIPGNWQADGSMTGGGRAGVPAVCVRAFDWEMRSAGGGSDGRTLEGYAAVFNAPATIRDAMGEFEEVILPGAFERSLQRRKPVLQFEHGRDPRVGATPIGAISDIREDSQGLYVRARLFANDAVEPVREAIAEGAISGMSFRFSVPQGGDIWQSRKGGMDLREIREADTAECGPVVFPAYDQTSVTVRSLLAQLDGAEYGALIRELAADIRALPPTSFAGRPAVGAGGGESDGSPGNGGPSPSPSARVRDRALRMKGILT